MRRGAGAAVLLFSGVAVLLVGCTANATPTPSRSTPLSARTTTPPASMPMASLVVPRRLPGEIARTVVTPQVNDAAAADLPVGVRRFFLHLGCAGPTGTGMRYEVLHADGSSFGAAGTWTCDQTPGVLSEQRATQPGGGVQIRLQPDPGVTGAYAVLTTTSTSAS